MFMWLQSSGTGRGDLPPVLVRGVAAVRRGVGHVLAHLVVVLVEHLHLAHARDVHGRHARLVHPLVLLHLPPLLVDVGEGRGAAAAAEQPL